MHASCLLYTASLKASASHKISPSTALLKLAELLYERSRKYIKRNISDSVSSGMFATAKG